MSKLEEAREYFGKDLYASQQTGIVIEAAEAGYAKCSLKIEDKHRNALGQVMGGVFFTMADYAFAIASNFMQPPTVTQTSQIVYLSQIYAGYRSSANASFKLGIAKLCRIKLFWECNGN